MKMERERTAAHHKVHLAWCLL